MAKGKRQVHRTLRWRTTSQLVMETKGTTMSKQEAIANLKDADADHTEARKVLKKAGFSTQLIHRIEDGDA
jgi:hypothetical protein|tara:strand:+ start:346 stop:558 length:213 start_codon:yes stop_codon:yes gene_type:complete